MKKNLLVVFIILFSILAISSITYSEYTIDDLFDSTKDKNGNIIELWIKNYNCNILSDKNIKLINNLTNLQTLNLFDCINLNQVKNKQKSQRLNLYIWFRQRQSNLGRLITTDT